MVEVSTVDMKPVMTRSLTLDEEEMLNKLMEQGLDNVPSMTIQYPQNHQASASFDSQRELDVLNVKGEHQEDNQTTHEHPKLSKVEPLLSV